MSFACSRHCFILAHEFGFRQNPGGFPAVWLGCASSQLSKKKGNSDLKVIDASNRQPASFSQAPAALLVGAHSSILEIKDKDATCFVGLANTMINTQSGQMDCKLESHKAELAPIPYGEVGSMRIYNNTRDLTLFRKTVGGHRCYILEVRAIYESGESTFLSCL